MTFGLCNAPATFQTFMDTEFWDLIETGHVVIYLDDILIFAETELQLLELTRFSNDCWTWISTYDQQNVLSTELR